MEPNGRVALVTGAARRVGRALALGLGRAGMDVIVHYYEAASDAARTVADLEALGVRAVSVQADVGRGDDVRRLLDAAVSAFGRLDVLVNSASLFERTPFADIGEAEWDRVLAVNLRGPFQLSQGAAPLLAVGGGTIVNIADLSAFQTWPSYVHHAVSKAGLVHLTRQLARVLAPAVRVNAIAPGHVLPPEDDDGHDSAGGPDRRVLAAPGRAEDVVEALLYLVRTPFVTGIVVPVDGGRMLL
jgi:pteridine reductase